MGGHSCLQAIFPTQGLNLGFPYCRHSLPFEPPYHLTNLFSLLPRNTARLKIPDPLAIRCDHVYFQAWLMHTSWEIVSSLPSLFGQIGVDDSHDCCIIKNV